MVLIMLASHRALCIEHVDVGTQHAERVGIEGDGASAVVGFAVLLDHLAASITTRVEPTVRAPMSKSIPSRCTPASSLRRMPVVASRTHNAKNRSVRASNKNVVSCATVQVR